MTIFDSFRLTNDIIVMTGGAGSLGRAMADALLSAGARVILVDINDAGVKSAASQLSAKHNGRCYSHTVDLVDERHTEETVASIIDRFGQIDVLFNNAGIAQNISAQDIPYADWKHVVDANLNAVYLMSREVGRGMIAAGGGRIINTSSISALIANVPQPQSAYNASKAGVSMLTKCLAVEWAQHGIRVNAIAPGYMRTEMTCERLDAGGPMVERWMSMTPMGRPGEPHELGGLAVFLASEASSYITGSEFTVDGGYTAI